MTDEQVLQRLRKRGQQRYRRYVKRGKDHAPRHRYDCARCKFSWSCGELCLCVLNAEAAPRVRRDEVKMLLETWRRTRDHAPSG